METLVQSEEIFFFWFSSRDSDTGGRSAWSEGCHISGIDSSKLSLVGKTALHRAQISDVSMASSAARRPWTVIGPMRLEMLLGTVWTVRMVDIGTVNIISPACLSVRMSSVECVRKISYDTNDT